MLAIKSNPPQQQGNILDYFGKIKYWTEEKINVIITPIKVQALTSFLVGVMK
jgi:hypothetical protein